MYWCAAMLGNLILIACFCKSGIFIQSRVDVRNCYCNLSFCIRIFSANCKTVCNLALINKRLSKLKSFQTLWPLRQSISDDDWLSKQQGTRRGGPLRGPCCNNIFKEKKTNASLHSHIRGSIVRTDILKEFHAK